MIRRSVLDRDGSGGGGGVEAGVHTIAAHLWDNLGGRTRVRVCGAQALYIFIANSCSVM